MASRPQGFKGLFRGFTHLRPSRIWLALVGSKFDPPHIRELAAEDEDRVATELEALLKQEIERAEETRKRSDQLLTRIIAVAPFGVGLLAIAVRRPIAISMGISTGMALISVSFLLISLFSILGNLGRETFYTPVTLSDIVDGLAAQPMSKSRRISETMAAIVDREPRNNDAINRMHTSYAALVGAVVIGLAAGAILLITSPIPPS